VVGDVTVDVTVVTLYIVVGVVEYSVETTVVAYVIVVGLVTNMVEQVGAGGPISKPTDTEAACRRFRYLSYACAYRQQD
jgi:hypothetical protein